MPRSFSRLTARVCGTTGKTLLKAAHGGAAARPQLLAQPNLQPNEAAICTMGARGSNLRESLEMRIRAETGTTLMVDSTTPVTLSPAQDGEEYGIGIHASVESGALLVITPDAHVPCRDANTGLWTRYDLSPSASLVSVQLADLKAQASQVGGRYTCRTRVHHAKTSPHDNNPFGWSDGFMASDSLEHIGDSSARASTSSCGIPFDSKPSWRCDWSYGRRFQGLVMGTPTTNVIASVIMAGPRADDVVNCFKSIDGMEATYCALGLLGEVHLAVQDVRLSSGDLVVARLGTEHREDMHRIMHHALGPLETQLGKSPYARRILSSSTAATPQRQWRVTSAQFRNADGTTKFTVSDEPEPEQRIHVQHAEVQARELRA